MKTQTEHNADVLKMVDDLVLQGRRLSERADAFVSRQNKLIRDTKEEINQLEQQLAGIAMRNEQLNFDADDKAIESLA